MSRTPPTQDVIELMRRLAGLVLETEVEWVDVLDQAALSGEARRALADDPVLSAGSRRNTRASVRHWAASNVSRPCEPVSPYVSPETMTLARDLARRGLDATALSTFRTAQDAAMLLLVDLAFLLAPGPAQAQELLSVAIGSLGDFVSGTIDLLVAQIDSERADLHRGSQAERREVVALVLDGAPITAQRAEQRLSYPVDRHHTALVVWSDEPAPDVRHLEQVTELLASGRQSLTVQASAATVWAWICGPETPSLALAEEFLGRHPHVRVSAGTTGAQMSGFRQSHLEALAAQRILAQHHTRRAVTFTEVRLVSLGLRDPESTRDFIASTLGALATAKPELRGTLRSYLREECNASAAAKDLFVHRNTFLRRLERAQGLLPRPLGGQVVDVGAALEMHYWLGYDTRVRR